MEAENTVRADATGTDAVVCAECLAPTDRPVAARSGAALCAQCASTYYAPCADCAGLVPHDEAVARDGAVRCADCDAKALAAAAGHVPDGEELRSLVDEYVRLDAESKQIEKRLGEIKEMLKAAASARERVANAVTLKSEDAAVKCSFSTRLKCDNERAAALEGELGEEQFSAFFERKTTYSPIKSAVEPLLSDTSEERATLREAVLSAVDTVEVPTLTVPRKK